jgi:hypothetical protein
MGISLRNAVALTQRKGAKEQRRKDFDSLAHSPAGGPIRAPLSLPVSLPLAPLPLGVFALTAVFWIRCVDAAGGQTRGPGQVAGYVWEGGE